MLNLSVLKIFITLSITSTSGLKNIGVNKHVFPVTLQVSVGIIFSVGGNETKDLLSTQQQGQKKNQQKYLFRYRLHGDPVHQNSCSVFVFSASAPTFKPLILLTVRLADFLSLNF